VFELAVQRSLWQNGANHTLTNLGTLPGDFAAIATGINNRGQVVGSTRDSSFNWSRAFIWQNGVMTDLNTLFPASSNLFATMANKINERGQISGMGTVLSGPDAGKVQAFLATPVNASIGTSVADVARTHPNLPANDFCRESDPADPSNKGYFRSFRTEHSSHLLRESARPEVGRDNMGPTIRPGSWARNSPSLAVALNCGTGSSFLKALVKAFYRLQQQSGLRRLIKLLSPLTVGPGGPTVLRRR
jgi:probable HAF family extracellular repeat protein